MHYEILKGDEFVEWVAGLKTSEGIYLQFDAINTHRAAILNQYCLYGKNIPKNVECRITTLHKGLICTRVIKAGLYGDRLRVGKDPLHFQLNRFLCDNFSKWNAKEATFGKCFFTMCCNLMCRANNAFSIYMHHIEWAEDSLSVYFDHSKTDSLGSQEKYTRHVYANPLQPEVCPILLLGIYC